MVTVYLGLVIVSPDNGPRVFTKLTELPFPCPIGTTMVIPDCEPATVGWYYYQDSYTGKEEFTSFLSPMYDHQRATDPERDFSRFFGYDGTSLERVCLALIDEGWNEKDTTNYILPL